MLPAEAGDAFQNVSGAVALGPLALNAPAHFRIDWGQTTAGQFTFTVTTTAGTVTASQEPGAAGRPGVGAGRTCAGASSR